MERFGRVAAGVLVGASLVAPAVAAGAEVAPRATYSDQFTTTQPGASAGRLFTVDLFNTDDREAKPVAITDVDLTLADGAVFNTKDTPQCKASDLELMLMGGAACPAASSVGAGTLELDTGAVDPLRKLNTDSSFFNNEGELIIVAKEQLTGLTVVVRGKIAGNKLHIDFPFFPGFPDAAADSAEKATFTASSTKLPDGTTANYLTTPPTCPPSGTWVNRVTYTFSDGVKQSFESASPCKGAAPRPPAASKPRLVRNCIGRGRMRVRVLGSNVASVRFVVGKRRVTDATRPFRLVVGRRGLKSAHRVRASVRLADGQTVQLSRSAPGCGVRRS